MSNGIRLEVGLLRTDKLKDEVLMEMLDHLGIIYSENNIDTFPCIIASTKSQLVGKNVIIADEIIPLDDTLNMLSGNLYEAGDSLNLEINEHEKKILDSIRSAFHDVGLPLVRKWFWPNFAKACCILTHDIDWLTYSPFHRIVLRSNSITKTLILIFRYLLTGIDYGYNIPEILEIETNRKVKSTFFFMTDYQKDNAKGRDAERLVKGSGCEIGLHGSRGSHRDITILRAELERLQRSTGVMAEGVRYHRLKFQTPLTWSVTSDACLNYDTTYSDHYFGFKVPLCFPFHPINRTEYNRYNVIEIPTAFMDWIALNRKYKEDHCKDILNRIMTVVEQHNGCFAINFHNTYLNADTFHEMYNTYIWMLDNLASRGYWITSAINCCSWWMTRFTAKLNIELRDQKVIGNSSIKDIPVVIEKASGENIFLNIP